jgi:error-prone DNA polymerase
MSLCVALTRHRAVSRYAELRCKTNFTFLQGASHPEEMVRQAAAWEYAALAITDVHSLAGVVRAHAAAKDTAVKLIIGAEIQPIDALPVVLYAPDLAGYRALARLITRGRRAAAKGECRLTFQDLAEHAAPLLAAVVGTAADTDAVEQLREYRALFADRCYLAAAVHLGPTDADDLARTAALAKRVGLPLLATNDVHYHHPERRPLHDVLTAIRYHTTVADLGARRWPNGERHLKSPRQMAELFAAYPEALRHTLDLAERCRFSLEELRYDYPEELCPPGQTPTEYLRELTWAGARERYPQGIPDKVRDLLERELGLIAELRYEAYFLTVWDLVTYARRQGILCQGRGSAANSAVCFCLGITSVDPGRIDVLFERFISRERNEAPDIDVDFEHERREEVFQYIWRKYGRERAAIVAEVITYRPRSAVRDVGKALGFSVDTVDRLAKAIDAWGETDLAGRLAGTGVDRQAATVQQLIHLATELIGFPRHLSQHVGGFVITRGALADLVPIENAAMPERTVIQWNKDDLDTLGILKVDCLSLGMLTAIHKCFDLVERHQGVPLTLATVPAEDPAVYAMIRRADTVGVFQIESRAQMSMLPRLQPQCFYDLVIEVAIVRPGPIQGGMVHPYLRRRNGEEPVTFPSPLVAEVLGKTLGVPLFQEQAMRLAIVAAGFTPGEADQLRRAMGAWRRTGAIEKFRAKLRDGMRARGIPDDFAARLYEQLRGFGEYGFPESHAASFALLAYVSAWLKCHYPAAFTAALLNSQPMGFYAPAQLVRDAIEHGVSVHPVEVNYSEWDCTLEPACPGPGLALRLGFRLVQGWRDVWAKAIVAARAKRLFHSVRDVARRSQVPRSALARLAAADAFRSLGLDRRSALWQVLALQDEPPLFAHLDEETPVPPLPRLTLNDQVVADYRTTGLSLKAHPVGLLRPELERLGVVPAVRLAQVAHQRPVRVAGLVLMRQRPATAKGTMFITLEDETGIVNLVIWRSVWERYRRVVVGSTALFVEGIVEHANRVIHVMPKRIDDLSHSLQGLGTRSRDFR